MALIGVVADADTAQALQASLQPGQRLVDPEGGLWRWDGLVRRPEAQDGAAAARLETRRRLADLEEAINEAEERLALARAEAQIQRDRQDTLASAEREARDALRAADRAASEARSRLAALERDAAAAASRLAGLDDALAQADADREEAETQVLESEAALDTLGDAPPTQAEAESLRTDLARARSAQVSAQAEHDRLRRETEEIRRQLDALLRDETSWKGRQAEALAQAEELEGRQQTAEEALEDLAGRPEALAEQREVLSQALEDAEIERRAAADALVEGERAARAADKALRDIERGEAQAREGLVRAEASVEAARAECRTVATTIAEKRDCTPEALAADLPDDASLPPLAEAETALAQVLRERDALGPVNLRAEQEARELEEQVSTLTLERDDLVAAIARLRQGINELNKEGRARLLESFRQVDQHFQGLFQRLFGGGRAHLTLVEAEDPLEAGLEIMASPPGKRLQSLSLLSGGEQALTATALLFAVFLTNPAPICVLDEVDAPLDDANVDRFCTMLRELTDTTRTRFLVVTHHRMTMARMDRLFGVTMAERGVSSLVSVDLRRAADLVEN
ncbi:Condensin subunit Smc [Pararhodospirillum photometricum DSM 122]|uniref:Condensin subunit Smc n=1 Tax=Pararhodospirillum photometricum DSM 122 TaxID=1150469 RepID=H6SPZ6_PARPM|nr:Condensin subunit Smc [Pararhodospirillum photometricum DSM 122]